MILELSSESSCVALSPPGTLAGLRSSACWCGAGPQGTCVEQIKRRVKMPGSTCLITWTDLHPMRAADGASRGAIHLLRNQLAESRKVDPVHDRGLLRRPSQDAGRIAGSFAIN